MGGAGEAPEPDWVSKRFGFPNAPIGTFLSASPIFIVDTAAGKLGNWQSENHRPMPWKRNFRIWQAQDAESITKFDKHVASDLSRIDFKKRLVQAVLLFQEGLESDRGGAPEILDRHRKACAREERETTERIVERASSILDDYRHAAMRLNFIQEFRNKIVHPGEAGDHALLCAQYDSLYLAALIRFFLWNIYKFWERDVILDFLSLPLDEQKLAHPDYQCDRQRCLDRACPAAILRTCAGAVCRFAGARYYYLVYAATQ
jgi:hypothetical protein